MKSTNLKTIVVAIPLALWASHAVSKSILVTGSIETVSPKVSIPVQGDKQAYVNPFQMVAEKADGSGCLLTGDPSVAKADHGDSLVCLFEWTDLPSGITAAGMAVDGYLLKEGANNFGYSISYFSGSNLDKVEIISDAINVNAIAPIAPEFTGVKTTLSHGAFTGLNVTNYNQSSGISTIQVSADARDYRQVASINGLGSCVIEVGETACDINAGTRSIGVEGQETGQIKYGLTLDSFNGYFDSQNKVVPEDYVIKWDYRSPQAEGLYIQARSKSSATIEKHEVDGVSIVVENEQAKLIVDTPHFGLPGSWWVPSAKLELTPDPDFEASIPVFTIDGQNVVETQEMVSQPQENFVLSAIGAPEVRDGKYIFTYDLHSVADGQFLPVVTLTDEYDNKTTKEYPSVTLDRNPPTVQLMYKGQNFINEGDVYFFENMVIIALDTFDGGAEIISAKVNGVTLDLLGNSKYIKYPQAASLNLTPSKEYPFEITVKDTAGNYYTKAFIVNYMPMDYSLDGSDLDYYKKVQRLDLDVDQTKGNSCALYSSEAELHEREFRYGESVRCWLEWTNLPPGTDGSYIRGTHSLTGSFTMSSDEMVNEVGYRVWMYDDNGNHTLAAEKSTVINVSEVEPPSLSIKQDKVISENLFPVELNGSRFTTAIAKGVNADLELVVNDGTEEITTLSKQRNGRTTSGSAYDTLEVSTGQLWARKQFNVNAKYSLDSSKSTKANLETVYVPSRRIRSRLSTDDLRTLDTVNPTVTMKLGVYDSDSRDFVYDKQTMGDWKVYLATERRDRETRQTFYDKITDVKDFNGQSVTFDLDVSDVGYGSYRFVGVAELQSPVEGYSRTVLSNSAFYRVLKGGPIDGEIKTYRIAAPVPFTASVTYQPEEREDREAMGDITWEMSVNGTDDWKVIEEYQGSPRLRQLIENAAHYFVRATVKNKLSGEVRRTDTLEILGYEVPDLKSEGPIALYEGEKGTVTLYDNGELASELRGQIEWSYDGDNWFEGGNTLDIIGTGDRMKIWSRMSYFNNELAEEKRYDMYRRQVSVKKPKPVRISIQKPRIIEVGKPVTLNAIVRLATSQLKSEVVNEWVLPDGTTVDGTELTYTPTEADGELGHTDITFHSYVKQLREDTYATKELTINTWKYKFPDYRFDVNYRTRYAPVTATAIARKLESQPVNVEFTYNYLMFDGMEVERQSNERLYFSATKPGLHQLTVAISDDRGNSKEITEIMEVLEPPETQIELTANYSTEFMRDPLDASIRARVELGHPDDRVATYEWYLDDTLLDEQTSTRAYIEGMTEGKHQIKVKVTSEFGIVQEQLLDVQVAPNKPPSCNITYKQYSSTIAVESGCVDPDGDMATHNWFVDGELVHVHADNVSVTGRPGKSIHFRVVGYDDSGDKSEATLVITPE
ncbi:Ig-like domain-containing protein [Vibrio sp. 1159]|uniref:Ig-like domain-containing protein n=2 Tax=Vibrio TaxID=662 RepID=UPI0029646CF4|nr:Ig-like domain-containing protein [Vibrio sp. 1159]MDW2323139.1 Ig-like domain-containing protein [Vibrio sp. 1159]